MTRDLTWVYCEYSAEGFGVIGYNVSEANDWLAAHPEYRGPIHGDWLDGSPRAQFDATELFFPEPNDGFVKLDATLAQIEREINTVDPERVDYAA